MTKAVGCLGRLLRLLGALVGLAVIVGGIYLATTYAPTNEQAMIYSIIAGVIGLIIIGLCTVRISFHATVVAPIESTDNSTSDDKPEKNDKVHDAPDMTHYDY